MALDGGPRPVQEENEDDYMSMVIEDPQSNRKENSIQRAARKKREVGASISSCFGTRSITGS
jgi:hypothetical protein